MFCSHCGRSIPDESRFCFSCGESLDAIAELSRQQSEAEATRTPLGQPSVSTETSGTVLGSLRAENCAAEPPVARSERSGISFRRIAPWVLMLAAVAGLGLLKHRADLRASAAADAREGQEGENRAEFRAVIDRSMTLVLPRANASEGSLPFGSISYPWLEGCHSETNQVKETILLSDCRVGSLFKESHSKQFEYRDVDQYVRTGASRQLASVVLNIYRPDSAKRYNSGNQPIDVSTYSRDVWVVDLRHDAVTAHRTFESESPGFMIPDLDAFEKGRAGALAGRIKLWLDSLAAVQ